MSQYNYSPEDEYNRSANRLREEMERRIQEEQYQRYLRDLDSSGDVSKPLKAIIKKEARSVVTHDPIANEIRDAWIGAQAVGTFALGLALCVASCASDNAYNNAMERAKEEYSRESDKALNRRVDEAMDNQTQTLNELIGRVDEKRKELESSQASYYVEYRETRTEAQQAIKEAQRNYDREQNAIRTETQQSDKTYNQAVGAANEQYKRDVERIKSEYSGAEKTEELKRAEERRNTSLENAKTQHENEIKSLSDRAATNATTLKETVNHQNDVIRTAQIKRNEGIASAEQSLTNAQARADAFISQSMSRNDMMDKIARESNGRIDEYHATPQEMYDIGADRRRVVADIATGNFGAAAAHINTLREHQDSNYAGTENQKFVQTIADNHKRLGYDIAMKLGTADEVAAMKRMESDDKAEREYNKAVAQSKKDGTPPPTPPVKLASDEDRRLAMDTVKKYTGSLGIGGKDTKESERILSQTISEMKKSADVLSKENNVHLEKLGRLRNQENDLSGKIDKLEGQLKEIHNAHKMLADNKDANGVALTKEQRAAITAKINSMDSKALRNDLAQLKADKKSLTNDISKTKKAIDSNNLTIIGINEHTDRLTKFGKQIVSTKMPQRYEQKTLFGSWLKDADGNALIKLKDKNGNPLMKKVKNKKDDLTNQKGNAMQHFGQAQMFKSLSVISREFNKSLSKDNVIQSEMMGYARKFASAARKYNLALGIGKSVAKFLGNTNKLTMKGIKLIGGKTRLGKALQSKFEALSKNAKFQKMMRFGKATKNTGFALGGKLINAPLKILNAPMKMMNWHQTLAKNTAKAAWRTTRKVTGRVGRAAAKGTKALAKHTIGRTKFGKRMGKRIDKIKDRLSLSRQRWKSFRAKLAELNPLNKLKKQIVMKILTPILSALTTALSYVLGAVAGVIGAFGGLLLMILIIVLAASMLISIINAVVEWIKSLGAQHDTYVKNQPEYIMNMIVNYRNQEMRLYELFKDGDFEITNNPICHTYIDGWVFDGETIDSVSFDNRGAEQDINLLKTNLSFTKYTSNGIEYTIDNNGYINSGLSKNIFLPVSAKYDNKIVNYYSYTDYYSNGATSASGYEISNAKDALAMMDTLYADDNGGDKDLQVHEVLGYLGVGPYQKGEVAFEYNTTTDADGNTIKTIKTDENGKPIVIGITAKMNLFWATHRFEYTSGTKSSQVMYHATQQSANDPYKYVVMANKKYVKRGDVYLVEAITTKPCYNQKTIEFEYQETISEQVYPHRSLDQYDWEHRACYPVTQQGVLTEQTKSTYSVLTPMQFYYYFTGYDYTNPDFGSNTVSSIHTSAGLKSQSVYTLTTNKVSKDNLIDIYNLMDDDMKSVDNRVSFFRKTGNDFRVVDSSGYYLGTYTIEQDSQLWNMITKANINNLQYDLNTSDTNNSFLPKINLEAFYIIWDAENEEFLFRVVGETAINNKSTIRQINSSISGGSDSGIKPQNVGWFTYPLPYFSGAKFANNTACSCPKVTETKDVTRHGTFSYCTGHLDLVANIVVTTIVEDGDQIFKDAQALPDVATWKKSQEAFLGIVIYSNDDEYGVDGWGGYTLHGYSPSTDWKKEKYTSAAKQRATADFEYEIAEGKNISELSDTIKDSDGNFAALGSTSDGKMTLAIKYKSTLYYVTSYSSGEQKDLVMNDNTRVSFKIINGKPYVQ